MLPITVTSVNGEYNDLSTEGVFVHLLFNQIERLLAELHDIPPKRYSALNARLKHFKRLGFPAGVNTGRGVAAKYDASAIVRLLLAFEFLQFGMGPEKAVQLIRAFPKVIAEAAGYAGVYMMHLDADGWNLSDKTEGHVLFFDPDCLATLADPESDNGANRTFYVGLNSEMEEKIAELGRRGAFINTTSLIVESAQILQKIMGISPFDFGQSLQHFAMQNEWVKAAPWFDKND